MSVKLRQMKTAQFKIILLSSAALIVLASVIYFSMNKSKNKSELVNNSEDVRTVKSLNITAKDDKFTPSEITTELFGDLDLVIKAEDKDYSFSVDGYPRFNTDIKKGETKVVNLYSLGVGEYNYFCSDSCGGKIIVKQKVDEVKVNKDGSIIEVDD